MNSLYRYFLFFIVFFLVVPVVGMQLECANFKAIEPSVRFISTKDNIPGQIISMFNNEKYTNYSFRTFVLSNKGIINAIEKARERGAKVIGTISTHKDNNKQLLGIEVKSDCHGKTWTAANDTETETCIPSENASNYAYHNLGTGVVVKNDPEVYKAAHSINMSKSPEKVEKEIITLTPTKNCIYSSHKVDLNASKVCRIRKVAESKEPGRQVYVRTMNLKNWDIAHAMIDAAKSGADVRLLVNKSVLGALGEEQLQSMHDEGVVVSVYDAAEKNRYIHHSKAIDIINGNKHLHIESSANLTPEGNAGNAYNSDAYFTGNKDLTAASIKNFREVEKKCDLFPEALKLHTACKQAKIEKNKQGIKRKLTYTEDKAKAKRKK